MRLGIISHHGGMPGGAEKTLVQYLLKLPPTVEPVFIFFEDGTFAQQMLVRYPGSVIVPMSQSIATSSRKSIGLRAFYDTLIYLPTLIRSLRKLRLDAVMTNTVKAHFIGSIAAKILGLPTNNYIHDVLDGPSLHAIRLISRLTAQSRMVCSRVVADSLKLDNTFVLYSPINITSMLVDRPRAEARLALGLPVDDLPVVGLVGRVAPWKGQDRFIRIAKKALAVIDAHFVIIGGPVIGCDPNYLEELKKDVKRTGYTHRIHFVSWQSDMSNVYSALDIACNCSTKEPFGRTTVEAQLNAVPVICFEDAGVCEIFEDGREGFQIKSYDELEYTKAITTFVNDIPRRLEAGTAGQVNAKRYDVAALSEIFNDVINDLH